MDFEAGYFSLNGDTIVVGHKFDRVDVHNTSNHFVLHSKKDTKLLGNVYVNKEK